jgi:excisionase family DNA binding protein
MSENLKHEPERLLRIPEAAKLLGIREKTLRDWVWRRKITFVKIGKAVAFRLCDLREFIEDRMVWARRSRNVGPT